MKFRGTNLDIFTGTYPRQAIDQYNEWLAQNPEAVIVENRTGVSLGYNPETKRMTHVYYIYIWYRDDIFDDPKDKGMSRQLLKAYLFRKCQEQYGKNNEDFSNAIKVMKELLRKNPPDEVSENEIPDEII